MSVKRKADENKYLVINGNKIEKVEKFKYLDLVINLWLDCDEEIKIRCGLAKETFRKLNNILIYREISLLRRLKVVQCYVIVVLLYGVEIWNIKATSMKRLEVTKI